MEGPEEEEEAEAGVGAGALSDQMEMIQGQCPASFLSVGVCVCACVHLCILFFIQMPHLIIPSSARSAAWQYRILDPLSLWPTVRQGQWVTCTLWTTVRYGTVPSVLK